MEKGRKRDKKEVNGPARSTLTTDKYEQIGNREGTKCIFWTLRGSGTQRYNRKAAMLRWLVAVATVVVRSASCDAVNDGTGVVLDMDADSFASTLQEHPFVAVSFTASWCGHCKRLEPEWAKAVEILATHKNDPPIVLAQVDCTADKNAGLTKDLDITAFPTIIVFRDAATDGEVYDLRMINNVLRISWPDEERAVASNWRTDRATVIGVLTDEMSLSDAVSSGRIAASGNARSSQTFASLFE